MDNKKRNLTKSALTMTLISVISLAFSFLQESFFAYFYGADLATDAYTVAIQTPITLFSIVSTAISTVIIPCYSSELYRKNSEEAAKYASNFISVISILTVTIIVVLELFANEVMALFAPGMDLQARQLSITLFRLVLPTILLTELMNINTGILNVHKSFVLPALTSNILNITFVASIAILSSKHGIYGAVIGTIIGTCLEFLYSIILRRRFVKYKPYINFKDEMMLRSIKMSLPVFIGIGAAEINKIVDRIVASFLEAGNISMLNYASKLSSAISSLFISSLTTVLFPELAKCSAEDDEKGTAEVFIFSISVFILIIVPIIAGGACVGQEIISVIYGRGKFTNSAVRATAPLFECYLTCLLFTSIRQVCSRVFYSYGDSKTPMKNSIIGIMFNIILNIVLGHYIGALGLALATTISTAIISFLLMINIKNKFAFINYRGILILSLKVIVASLIMVFILFKTKLLWYNLNLFSNIEIIQNLGLIVISLAIGGMIYLLMLILLRTNEINTVLKKLNKKRSE